MINPTWTEKKIESEEKKWKGRKKTQSHTHLQATHTQHASFPRLNWLEGEREASGSTTSHNNRAWRLSCGAPRNPTPRLPVTCRIETFTPPQTRAHLLPLGFSRFCVIFRLLVVSPSHHSLSSRLCLSRYHSVCLSVDLSLFPLPMGSILLLSDFKHGSFTCILLWCYLTWYLSCFRQDYADIYLL